MLNSMRINSECYDFFLLYMEEENFVWIKLEIGKNNILILQEKK